MKKILMIACLSFIIAGCYNDKADKLYPVASAVTCDTSSVTYAHDVLPILTANCNISGCHNAAGAPSSGGYDFTKYSDLKTTVNNDLLLGDIRWESGHSQMPKGMPKLSDCDINKISHWVNQGALNN